MLKLTEIFARIETTTLIRKYQKVASKQML